MFVRITLVVLVAAFLWAILVRDTGAGGRPHRYRVQPGDTLWSIAASRYAGDPREGVWKVEHANELSGATIVAGEVLLLP